MSFDYAALRDNTAQPLIERFGKDATLALTVPSTSSDPWNPQPDGTIETAVKVVQINYDIQDRAGTLVEAEDLMFLISTAGDPDVQLAQTISVEGDVYQVVMVEPLKPGPVTMLWKAQCRK